MEKKKLYAVSSLHYGNVGKRLNERECLPEILEVRLQIIGALAKTIGRGGFFCDSLIPEYAAELNNFMQIISLKDLIQRTERQLRLGGEHYTMYDLGSITALLKKLRQESCFFEFKPSEPFDDEEEQIAHHWNDLHRELSKHSEWGEFFEVYFKEERLRASVRQDPQYERVVRNFITEKLIELRDRDIIDNVGRHGEQENIVFIGRDHTIETGKTDLVNMYRLRITRAGRRICVAGDIPKKFHKQLSAIRKKTTKGKSVDVTEIAYQ